MDMTVEQWALITGSTSGIGKAIARELANKGYNIILHGRNQEELDSSSLSLTKSYGIKCLPLNLDLAQQNSSQRILQEIKSLNITILVNNAGFGVPGSFDKTLLDDEIKMAQVHVIFPMQITKHFAKAFKDKREGHILNVSSLYSFFPVPRQSIYGATKAFQHSFSLALYKELKEFNVHVSSLCPGLTYSKFRTRQGHTEKKHAMGLSSEAVAKIAIKGLFRKKPIIVPGKFNRLTAFLMPRLPIEWTLKLIDKMNRKRGY